MAVIKLENLVLRGSTVLLGGTAGNPRLGTSGAANPRTPEIRSSMRHPSLDWEQEFQPASRLRHADYRRVDALAAQGTGRSLSRVGVLRRSCLRPTTDIAALLASRRGTPAAIAIVKRCSAGRGWCKPAHRTERTSS